MEYQGEKLVSRFNTHSYWMLTKAMDSHHIARGRKGTTAEILSWYQSKNSGVWYSQRHTLSACGTGIFVETHSRFKVIAIDSAYGHDGFMVEAELISVISGNGGRYRFKIFPAISSRILMLQKITSEPTPMNIVLSGSLPTSFAAIGAAINPPMIKPAITCQ